MLRCWPRYKQRVLCCLLSHVNCCPLLDFKVALLKSVDSASNEAKAQMLEPTTETLLAADFQDASKRRELQDLATFAVSSFDTLSARDLNDTEKPLWEIYLKVLTATLKHVKSTSTSLAIQVAQHEFVTGVWERARVALLHRLQHGLFTKLSNDRKAQLCGTFLQVGAGDDSLVGINDITRRQAPDLTLL